MRLTEHYVTLTSEKEKKEQYYDEVMDILNSSYAKIGGPKSNVLNKMFDPSVMWKLVTRNGKVVAVLISKLQGGTRKGVLAGSDGSQQGKNDLYAIISEEIRQLERKSWIEVSGAMEHIYVNKKGGTPIPDDLAVELMTLLGKKVTPTGDGYHYTRALANGEDETKVIVGDEETLRAYVDAMKQSKGMKEGVSYMNNKRSIALAKKLVEANGYKITKKLKESEESSNPFDMEFHVGDTVDLGSGTITIKDIYLLGDGYNELMPFLDVVFNKSGTTRSISIENLVRLLQQKK